jgi:4-amino-4-deoxy-L-arabinose transferase-like glycosyltransferase
MTAKHMMRVNVALAALAGLALRFFFVLKLPVTDSGDAPFYIELAWNWLKKGVYGGVVEGQLMPLDTRGPGYPAFLAAIFSVAGNSSRAVMLTQAAVDLATCFVVALIAARLAPQMSRRRVALAGLWLAALCPFTANYTAVVLTETLVTFLTALAILLLVEAEARGAANSPASGKGALSPWFLAGVVVGFGALVRPETPLLLLAMGLVLVAKWWRPMNWIKVARAGVLMGVGLLLPLLPWAARNWRTLHEVQFLTPRYLQMPDDFAPVGFNAWTGTWLWRFSDVYLTLWRLNSEEIPISSIPSQAFDSPQEHARVSDMLDSYNYTLTLSREQDAEFGAIARERTANHPLRTYVKIPLLRSLTMWFTPRVELLPNSSPLRPVRSEWEDDRLDFVATLGLGLLDAAYIILALAGAWIVRGRPGVALLIVFILVRTAYIASVIETPEPRYVLECFPAVLALAAQVFAGARGGRRQLSSTGSG